ncbi:hypothetical protein F2Q70_00044513 [Brassica cretica]|uniref:Leucine-rich repeat-containing N-terminal plant-type domain-containing protein n=1 Tax=Brassica cretica TaxID=69181 RepID=A0A8S9KGN1_BRACR|nr:hypothetical protein F2Q70_00044513 [Brassica cretica]
MKGMFFLGKYLILVILVLGQLHGYKGCVEKERKALLEFVKYIISITIEEYSDYALPTWTYNTKSDCCRWEGVKCNRTSKRVTEIAFGTLSLKENSLLNLSLLHPFEDIRSLNLSRNNYYYNQFSGLFDDVEGIYSISPCGYKTLRKLRKLEIMDLSRNRFNNSIFRFLNSAISLKTLFLGDNNFYGGSLPAKELKDLTNLELLDLSGNRFNGSIPIQGNISSQLCGLRNIQLLDLANNRLNGSIPSCLKNTSFVFGKKYILYDDDYSNLFIGGTLFTGFSPHKDFGVNEFQDTIYFRSRIVLNPFQMSYSSAIYMKIEFAMKHRYDAYAGKNLNLLFGLDLSENELSGNIPTELGGLLELQAFNVSHNKLSGAIPESFSGLKNVESLDLSFNRLQGRIPQGLTELNSLAVFNVSFNNLSGVIPQGKQFNTFDAQSFVGNPLLCGKLTNRNCDGSTFQEPDNGVNDDESQIDMGSFYRSFLAAYVTILLGIFSSLPFDSPWSRFWFYVVDVFIHKSCGHSRRSHFPVTGLQSWMMVLGDVPALSDSASQLACPK